MRKHIRKAVQHGIRMELHERKVCRRKVAFADAVEHQCVAGILGDQHPTADIRGVAENAREGSEYWAAMEVDLVMSLASGVKVGNHVVPK